MPGAELYIKPLLCQLPLSNKEMEWNLDHGEGYTKNNFKVLHILIKMVKDALQRMPTLKKIAW